MKTLLTCNLSDNTALDGDSPWAPPVLTFGEDLTLALRFTERLNGDLIEPALNVTSLRASIGVVDARPQAREWALQIGPGAQTADNTTAAVPHDCAPAVLQAAINAKAAIVAAYGTAAVQKRDGSWFITLGSGAESVPMLVRDNTLFPLSFGQIGAVRTDAVWTHEVRLIQLPVAFVDSSARVLPPAPTVTRVRSGGTEGDFAWNEIQALSVQPDFRATYVLKFGYARTGPLSVEDDADSIQAALAAVLGDNFKVTTARDFVAHIEFINDLGGAAQNLLEVEAYDAPPGDLTFTLALSTAALLTWLRAQAAVTLPLEVRITVLGEDETTTTLVVIRQSVTIQRPLILAELAETPNVDWLRPPSPRDYIPRSSDTVFTGDKSAASVVGDSVATEFAVDHPFATTDVQVFAKENATNGRQLVDGTDFTVRVTDAGTVTVTTLGEAPADHAWVIYVRAAEPIAAFADGLTVTIGQVTGLEERLSAAETRIGILETLLPSGTLVRPAESTTATTILIPDNYLVFPNLRLGATFDPASLAVPTAQMLRNFPTAELRPPGLLPAIHDASVTTFSSGALPGSPTTGNVYQNTGSDPVLVPGGLGRRGRYLGVNEFVGWDGRVWYHLTRGATSSTSFFPSDFELELMPPITFESDTWRAGQQFTLQFDLAVQLIRANSNAQWVLVIEHGTVPSDDTPATTTLNLQNVVWNATPILTQRLVVSALRQTLHFGCIVARSTGNVMTPERLQQAAWSAGNAAPATPQFALRVRLIRFDTEDSIPTATGYAFAALTNATAAIS